MKTEQPEMDARPRTPENPISVQGPVTPLTEKLCNQENKSSLEQEEPGPQQIKEEQEEFWTNQEVKQFIEKQEIDIITVTSLYVEHEHREPEPNSEQLHCLTSTVTENQDEGGSRHVDSRSAESEELKTKRRRLKTRSHHEDIAASIHKNHNGHCSHRTISFVQT
ncbi:uncharacterized protein KZ484_000159 isoform 2-T2 [Pholidichthys leucotaenia]